jgi:MFS family permease
MQETHDPYAALRIRDYRRLVAVNVLGSVATQIQSVAVGWELYERTNSAAALGYVGLVQFLPVLFLSLPAGQAADRYSRQLVLMAAQGLMSITALGLAALSYWQGPVALVYVCLFFAGVSQAFNSPARWSLLPLIVPSAVLTNAVTWNSSAWQVAATAGPALAGFVIARKNSAMTAYVLTALSCAAALLLVATLRPRRPSRSSEPATLKSLMAGIRYVYRTKLILATITLDLFAVLLGGATALLPIYARDILDIGPVGLGWLRAAPSIGALLMALALAHVRPLQRAGLTLLWAVAGFGAATIVFGLSTNPWLSFAMLAATGALDNISIVVRGTLVQALTPDDMRGRVSAVNSIFIVSSNELGAFESGITAAWFGPVASVVAGGIGTIVVVLAVVARWPEVLRLGSLTTIQPTTTAEPPLAMAP